MIYSIHRITIYQISDRLEDINRMHTDRKRTFAVLGALSGALYFMTSGLSVSLPEFLLGALLGLAMVLLALSLLPEETLQKLRKWKCRG